MEKVICLFSTSMTTTLSGPRWIAACLPISFPSAAGIVGITAPQSVAAQAEGLAPVLCSKANNSSVSESLLVPDLQLPMNVQDDPHVFKETYVHGIYEESSACLNITSDVPDFSLEQQQNDENASLNVQQLRDPQLSLLVTHEKTEVWDPGDNTILSSTVTRDIVDVLQTSILTTSGILALPYVLTVRVQFGMPTCVPQQGCYGRVPSSRKTNGSHFLWDPGDIAGVLNTSILTEETSNHLTECNSQNYLLQSAEIRYPLILSYFFILRYCSVKCNSWLKTVLHSMCDQVEGMNHLSLTTPWDPGVLVMYYGITCNSTRTTRDVEWLKMSISTSSELPQSVSVICSPFHMMRTSLNAIFSVQMMHYAIQRLMANISCKVAALTWHNSITFGSTTSYIWDPGTMLLWYRFIWSLLTEGNEMGRLIPEQWSLRSNGMHYCQIFQKCNAMSSQLYWNQDIKLTGIDLWMIHFLPP